MPPKKRNRRDLIDNEDLEFSNRDIMEAISNLTTRVTDFENSITHMVDDKITGLEESIMRQVNEYKHGADGRMQQIEKRLDDFVGDMKATIEEQRVIIDKTLQSMSHVSSSDTRIDQLERQVRMNESVVSGVPYDKNEKIYDILSAICGIIKFSGGVSSIETSFRLPSNNKRRRSTPSIVVKFWGADAKAEFFKQYFAAERLCASMIGYTTASRIYVNENLTKRNFEIFKAARNLKKDGKISRFSTQRGRVFIKFPMSEVIYTVESLDHLHILCQQNATADNTNGGTQR